MGEHSNAWLPSSEVTEMQRDSPAHRTRHKALVKWGKLSGRSDLVEATLEELDGACATPEAEVERVKRLAELIFGFKHAGTDLCSVCRQEGAQVCVDGAGRGGRGKGEKGNAAVIGCSASDVSLA